MKKLLLIIFSLIPSIVYAQDDVIKAITDETYNFKIADGEVLWQYVYDTDTPQKRRC